MSSSKVLYHWREYLLEKIEFSPSHFQILSNYAFPRIETSIQAQKWIESLLSYLPLYIVVNKEEHVSLAL